MTEKPKLPEKANEADKTKRPGQQGDAAVTEANDPRAATEALERAKEAKKAREDKNRPAGKDSIAGNYTPSSEFRELLAGLSGTAGAAAAGVADGAVRAAAHKIEAQDGPSTATTSHPDNHHALRRGLRKPVPGAQGPEVEGSQPPTGQHPGVSGDTSTPAGAESNKGTRSGHPEAAGLQAGDGKVPTSKAPDAQRPVDAARMKTDDKRSI